MSIKTCPVCWGPIEDDEADHCEDCQPNSGWGSEQ